MTDPHVAPTGDPYNALPASGDPSDNLLRHYAGVLVRRWRWIVLGLIVGIVAGIASTLFVEETPVTTRYYKATTTLAQQNVDTNSGSATTYTLSQAALQSESQALLDKVGQSVDMSRDDVAASLSANVRPNVNAIDVTAIATEPELAVRLANTGAETLLFMAQAEAGNTTDAQRASLNEQLEAMVTQRNQLRLVSGGSPTEQVLRAQQLQELENGIKNINEQLAALPEEGSGFTLEVLLPASPIQINSRGYNLRRSQNVNARSNLPNPSANSSSPDFNELDLSTSPGLSSSSRVALGGAAGLILGLISAFVLEAWDDRVRRRDRVEELTGLGVLTEIPRLTREQAREHHVAVEDETTGIAAERYRAARTAVSFVLEDDDGTLTGSPVLMVTSPGPSEGKTTTVANLSGAFADAGYRVLVIDGDFRRPAVRRYLAPVPNLVSPDEPTATRIEGVSFLPGPHDAPTPEIANALLEKAVARWRGDYDLVILDTPPILTTNDAVDLLESADAVLLVLRADKTRANAARRVAELLAQYRANVLGVVLNSCDRAEMYQYYGYGYAYGYGYFGRESSKSPKGRRGPGDPPPAATPADPGDGGPVGGPATQIEGTAPAVRAVSDGTDADDVAAVDGTAAHSHR